MRYDVTLLTLRPGSGTQAVAKLGDCLKENTGSGRLLACWSTEIGTLNRIMMIREGGHEGDMAERVSLAHSDDPFGLGALLAGWSTDSFVSFPFLEPLQPGSVGPFFEVRTYLLKPGGLNKTIELWREALPGRTRLSPMLAAMYSTSGVAQRYMHIWPWQSLETRQRIRAQAVEQGLWPPKGGADRLISQQVDIYLPAPFSPIR